MREEIVFVNSNPAKCGCTMRFSSGGGEYSDVLYVYPCKIHSDKDHVIKDEDYVMDAGGNFSKRTNT